MRRTGWAVLAVTLCLAAFPAPRDIGVTHAQGGQAPGRSIGTISTRGDLIVFELNDGALGTANMFDLQKRTVRFTPGPGGYRAETSALRWDSEFGAEMTNPQVALRQFTFPFSGRTWDAFSVGTTGSIAFSDAPAASGVGRGAAPAGCTAGRWRPRRRRDDRPLRSIAGGGSDTRQRPAGNLRVHETAHVRHALREGASRSRRRDVESHRTSRRHPGLHVGTDRESLPGGAAQGWRDRDVVRRARRTRRDRRHLSARRGGHGTTRSR